MNYQNIEPRNIENGNGIRCVLWVSGCDHNCEGCFNPQTHDPKSGIEFDKDALDEIHDALNAEYCAGLTLSGGDPLFKDNLDTVLELCKMVKEEYHKTVWMWTGSIFESLILDNSEIDKAYELVDEVLNMAIETNKIELVERAYYLKGIVLQKDGNYRGAELYMNLSLDSLLKYGSKEERRKRYMEMGNMYYNLGEFKESIKYFSLAIEKDNSI